MQNTSYEEFCGRFGKEKKLPVCREFLADLETPVSILQRFREDENVFLLESIEGGEHFGRYSFIGVEPRGIFSVEDHRAFYRESGGDKRELAFDRTPLSALKQLLAGEVETADALPPFFGGAVGFIGYEAVNDFEELPPPRNKPDTPEAVFMLTDEVMIFDNVRHTIRIVITLDGSGFSSPREAYDSALERIGKLRKRIALPRRPDPVRAAAADSGAEELAMQSSMSKDEFCEMVRRGKQSIHDGEVIQLVLSRKFTAPLRTDPLRLYRALRFINPSPYTFFLKLGDLTLIGSSPETMVKLEGGHAELRPIAGTRPRGKSGEEDRRLAEELLADEKERAEHLMLVDLGRNDLGRVAKPGSVQLSSFMRVERYSHVMHLVSDVGADLREDCDGFDLVRAVFPAGTLSGAPKIRAMELIRELENDSRGIYGGAVGYFGYGGSLDLAITIRTMKIRSGVVTIQSGAGIVYDSVPEKEYDETSFKAGALFQAAKLAQGEEMDEPADGIGR